MMRIPTPDLGDLPALSRVSECLPELAAEAQALYDAWDQDADGMDPELGAGGICDRIAEAFLPVLERAGVEHAVTVQAACGENHTFVVALLDDGVYHVDIPPGAYEEGGGYSWRKLPGVRLSADDVLVYRVGPPATPGEFDETYRE